MGRTHSYSANLDRMCTSYDIHDYITGAHMSKRTLLHNVYACNQSDLQTYDRGEPALTYR